MILVVLPVDIQQNRFMIYWRGTLVLANNSYQRGSEDVTRKHCQKRSCHNSVAMRMIQIGPGNCRQHNCLQAIRPSLGHGRGRHWTRHVQINCCIPALQSTPS